MTHLQTPLTGDLAERLGRAVDREAKIPRAIDALGPTAARDVLVLAGSVAIPAVRLVGSEARVTSIGPDALAAGDAAPASADVLVMAWSAFRGPDAAELVAAERILRPGGRLLVVRDYGRDDVSRLFDPRPEYGEWSRRDGPFLGKGFKVRVVHSWWTFDSLEEAQAFLVDAFAEKGAAVGEALTRPRLSYNVAVYHRSVGAA